MDNANIKPHVENTFLIPKLFNVSESNDKLFLQIYYEHYNAAHLIQV